MTSEVVLMNRSAVALAADSAVTFATKEGQKIFQSANKLFTLSKFHPVGVMIYNNASILDVPWETIIKVYRQKIGSRSFPTVAAYADDFLRFLNSNERLFPQHHQDRAYLDAVKGLVEEILKAARDELFNLITEGKQANPLYDYVRARIAATHADWAKAQYLPCFDQAFHAAHRAAYRDRILETIKSVFENIALQQDDTDKLVDLAVWVAVKDRFIEGYSGIVVAGFGEDEIFPSMCSFVASLVIGNHLKKETQDSYAIGDDYSAIVRPFAQSDMVRSFTDGIDPNFKRTIGRQVMRMVLEFPSTIIDAITDLRADPRSC